MYYSRSMDIDWPNTTVRLNRWSGTYYWPKDADRDLSDEQYKEHMLWFLLDGRGAIQADDRVFRISPGSCVWLRPGKTYDYWQDAGQQLKYHYVSFDLLDTNGKVLRGSRLSLPNELLQVPDVDLIKAVMSHVAHTWMSQQHDRARLNSTRMFQSMLEELEYASRKTSAGIPAPEPAKMIRNSIVYIENHIGDPLSVPVLAERVGYSRTHFTRLFKAVTGRSPFEYIMSIRINSAMAALEDPDKMSITDIALVYGFQRLSLFSKQFRLKTGMSPTQYRKKHAKAPQQSD